MDLGPAAGTGRDADTGVEVLADLVKKGVRVRILTNSLASTDVVPVHSGYARYREALLEAGSAGVLRGSPDDMAETLQQRCAATGISYVSAGVDNADVLAPVVGLLRDAWPALEQHFGAKG